MATSGYVALPSTGGVTQLTTKGDLLTYSTQLVRLPVGTDGQVLSADSTQTTGLKWIAASGTGTVTSVAMTVPTFLSIAGSPVTTTGTLAVTYSGTALPVLNGGTGATTAAAALTSLGAAPTASPTFTGTIGTALTASKVVQTDSSGNLTTGSVALATQVSGNLPVTNLNSGTSASSSTFWRGDGTWAAAAGGITALTGDVTASGSGSVAATVAAIAGVAVGTPTGTGNVVFSASPTLTGTITAAAITASGKITSSSVTSFTASGTTYTYDMTATNSIFGRVSTSADTGTITLQANTALNNDTHGGASIVMTANDGSATNSGSLDLYAYGTGGATTNEITFNTRTGTNATNQVGKFVNGGLLMASGKALQLQGSGAFTVATGASTFAGQFTVQNHGIYAGNNSASIAANAFSRLGFAFSGDLNSATTTYGLWIDPQPKGTSTTAWSTLYTYVNTNGAGSVTIAQTNSIFLDDAAKAAGGAITYNNQILAIQPSVGTNIAVLSDDSANSLSGSYFIKQVGTTQSQLGGNLILGTAGKTLTIKSGSNACQGQATLSGGTVTISTTATPATSQGIFITDAGGSVTNIGTLSIGTVTAGTSFVINSTNVLDGSTVNWVIFGH